MKKLLIAAVTAVSLVATFVTVAPVRDAQARPDCQAVDYNGDGFVDIQDIVAAQSMAGSQGRAHILVSNFGEPC